MNPKKYGRKDIVCRTFEFAIAIIQLTRKLPRDTASFVVGRQLIRSGTSVGANTKEALLSSTRKNFAHKLQIALSEIDETIY